MRLRILRPSCLAFCLLLVVSYVWLTLDAPLRYRLNPNPAHQELPKIEDYVRTHMPGVSIYEINDIGPDDEHNVYLTLDIRDKGIITLYNARLKSFTGGGRIDLVRVGDCRLPSYFPDLDNDFARLHIDTVPEVVENYDWIYERVRQDANECFRYRPTPQPTIPPHVQMAQSRVQLGDEREMAVQALSDAWHHVYCDWDIGGWDYFLYGGRTHNTVQIVVVHYNIYNGRKVVDFIGNEDPNNRPYATCIPEHVFKAEP